MCISLSFAGNMKRILTLVFSWILTAVLLLGGQVAQGQCAMCKATVNGNEEAIGEGLNNGILYLMAAPYVLFLIVGLVFFRKKIAAFYKAMGESY